MRRNTAGHSIDGRVGETAQHPSRSSRSPLERDYLGVCVECRLVASGVGRESADQPVRARGHLISRLAGRRLTLTGQLALPIPIDAQFPISGKWP